MDEELADKLPPTDSWRRPDMWAMERGDYETAEREKRRLEQEQWERRKQLGCEPPPKYFTKHVIDEKKGMYWYEYGKPWEYWADRKNKDWNHMTRLFD